MCMALCFLFFLLFFFLFCSESPLCLFFSWFSLIISFESWVIAVVLLILLLLFFFLLES